MRILTPTEQREVERIKQSISKLYFPTDDVTIVIDYHYKELWLNILDLALQQNDAMKESWRKDKLPNWTDEVVNKLRPNG